MIMITITVRKVIRTTMVIHTTTVMDTPMKAAVTIMVIATERKMDMDTQKKKDMGMIMERKKDMDTQRKMVMRMNTAKRRLAIAMAKWTVLPNQGRKLMPRNHKM